MLEKYPLVMVDWEDHTASAEWEDDVDSCTYEVCRTIGWFILFLFFSFSITSSFTLYSFLVGISFLLFSFVEDFWHIEMSDEET